MKKKTQKILNKYVLRFKTSQFKYIKSTPREYFIYFKSVNLKNQVSCEKEIILV